MTLPDLRPALPSEAAALTDLTMRSKAFWGYDAAFMEACREELTVTPAMIDPDLWRAVGPEGAPVGMIAISVEGEAAELERVFIDPAIAGTGSGLGRRLFDWAAATARAAGATRMRVAADPGAEGFYRRMGMVRVGTIPSGSIPGRELPRLEIDLAPRA